MGQSPMNPLRSDSLLVLLKLGTTMCRAFLFRALWTSRVPLEKYLDINKEVLSLDGSALEILFFFDAVKMR